MANVKFSDFTAASAMADADFVVGLQGGINVKSTGLQIKTYISVSPTLTGTPTTPTAAPGTNTTQIASTAFVTAAIAVVTGATIAVNKGGTNLTSYTTGDLIQATGATTLASLAAVATGSVLISGGVGTISSWSASPTLTTSLTVPLIQGSVSASGTLTLSSTSNGTKGKLLFGTLSVYDEVNDRFGISQTTPVSKLDVTTNNLTTTTTMASGISVNNNQPATSGVTAQYSPPITFHGRRWTSSTDKTSDFRIYNECPATALDILRFQYSDNGGAYSTVLSLFFNGTLTTPSAFNALNATLSSATVTALAMAASSGINFNGAGQINYNGLNTANATGQISVVGNGTIAAITGTLQAEFGVGSTFAPASGSVDYTAQIIKSVIAQTSTASGNVILLNIKPTYTTAKGAVTGIDYNPTVTSITGTHIGARFTSGSVLIGGTTLTTSAILDLQSTTLALIVPRMTTTQRDAIASPSNGMVVYNTSTAKLNVYTTAWEAVTSL